MILLFVFLKKILKMKSLKALFSGGFGIPLLGLKRSKMWELISPFFIE